MIGELLVVLLVALLAGGVGLWLGIVILSPRLQGGTDRAPADEPADAAKESDGRAEAHAPRPRDREGSGQGEHPDPARPLSRMYFRPASSESW